MIFSWVSHIEGSLFWERLCKLITKRLICADVTWRYWTGLGSKSITGIELSFRLLGYLAPDSLRGSLFLFLPLFHEHSLLVQGFEIRAPCFVTWSRIENKTATTWLQRPNDEALQGSQEACITAPLFTDNTMTTLWGRSIFIDGQMWALTK